MMKKKGKLGILLMVIAVMLSVVGCNNEPENETDQQVVATFDGGQVTKQEFDRYLGVIQFLNPQLADIANQEQETKEKVLEEYIGEKYLAMQQEETYEKEAKQLLGVVRTQMINQEGSEDKYQAKLKEIGISEDDLLNYLKRYYAIQTHFVEQEYKENKEQFTVATVSHILIKVSEERTEEQAKERADEVLEKLESGEDFASLAKEYSDDPGSKDNGGTYENAPIAIWVPEFKEAALTLPIDKISEPVKTDYGYHIIKVQNREMPVLEKVSEEVKAQVMAEGYSQFIQNELPNIIKDINLTATK